MLSLQSTFGDRIITGGLQPPCSSDLNPCDVYLWGILKDEVYGNNPCTEDDLTEEHSGCSASFHFASRTSACNEQHVCYAWCMFASWRRPFPAPSLNSAHENLMSVARHWSIMQGLQSRVNWNGSDCCAACCHAKRSGWRVMWLVR
jgi:hypothetical protein